MVHVSGVSNVSIGDEIAVTLPFYDWTSGIMGALPVGMLQESCGCVDPVWMTPHGENWGEGMCDKFELFRTILSWVIAVLTCFTIWHMLVNELGRSIDTVKG